MTELEPQQNLYARLVQLRFTGDRSSSTWQAEVQGVLASSPATWGLAEIVNKLLKAESWEATPQVTRRSTTSSTSPCASRAASFRPGPLTGWWTKRSGGAIRSG